MTNPAIPTIDDFSRLNVPGLRRKTSRWRRPRFNMTGDNMDMLSLSLSLKETNLPQLVRMTIITLSVATFGFVLWASMTPVKELARTQGQVIPSGYTQLVQHLEGGLVRDILVQEGDFVQQGQILMHLDGAGMEEDWKEQSALVSALQLQGARLRADLANKPVDFSGITATPRQLEEQLRMYETTRNARATERSVIESQIAERQNNITRLQRSLVTAQANLGIATETRDAYESLAQSGHTSRMMLLKKREDYNIANGQVHDIDQQIAQARNELSEYRQRLNALTSQQRDASYNELHKVEADLAQARQLQKKREGRVDRLEVRAPVSGFVKGIRVNTIGSVVPAGQTLMEIVPTDERLIVETRVPPQQVGRLSLGQAVQVRVDSYDYVRYGTIPGTLDMISATTFTDEGKREEYYKARVRLDRNYAGSVPGQHLIIPGMTVSANIVIGEKSVLAYLLKPIRSAMSNSMTEQ